MLELTVAAACCYQKPSVLLEHSQYMTIPVAQAPVIHEWSAQRVHGRRRSRWVRPPGGRAGGRGSRGGPGDRGGYGAG